MAESLTVEDQVMAVIDQLRPFINMDGGDIDLVGVDIETGIVTVQLFGACETCSMTQITLKAGVEAKLKETVPGITEVVAV